MLRKPALDWMKRLGRRWVDRRAVQELSRSLALIVDREALETSFAARLRELFNPDRLLLLESENARSDLVPGHSTGIPAEDLAGVRLAARGKLARWLAVNESALVLRRQPGVLEYLEPGERELLLRLRLDVVVPLVSLNRLTGVLLLGADDPGWRVDRRDADLLVLLASQASLAFENAALYRAERERLDRLHRAERLATVGQLAAGVAHEVRNPLTAIRSTMQYLLQGLDAAEPRHQLVQDLLIEVDRINGTVGGLLSLSRSGDMHVAPLDLREPLARATNLVQAQASQQGIEIRTSSAPGPIKVLGDAGQLEQVFLNLLLNALQTMAEGGRIEVSASDWPHDGGAGPEWVEVSIADTGPGMAPEELLKVFNPFYTTKKEGTGLGLAICHGILERHRGEISLESAVGRGTRASVRLPLLEGETWPTS